MKAKKIFKIIGIVILILVVIVLIYAIRNFTIIRKLQKKIEQYSSSNNFHIVSNSTQGDTTININYYTKDGKQAMILRRTIGDQTIKMSVYYNGSRTDTFYETKDSKQAKLNSSNELMPISIYNGLETDSNFQTFILCMVSFVKIANVNQKECYLIKNFKSPVSLNGESKNEIYVEKNTGLLTKSVLNNQVMSREYEFDNVDDSIFAEPDISQYTLK